MTNTQAAAIFNELADRLDLAGELPFKSNSYRKVANSLLKLTEPLENIVRDGKFELIDGAGKAIKEKLTTMVQTGQLPTLEKWRNHELAPFYSWAETLNLPMRPFGIIIKKLQAKDFKDLLVKLNGYDLNKLTGKTREAATKIIDNTRNI